MNESTPEQPEHAAQRAEARQLLEAKIDELPDAFRRVFVLRALEELSVEEAATALGIPGTDSPSSAPLAFRELGRAIFEAASANGK
jgi:DNA-directed RNA polymerase specialized sigma24 family protein